jgi:hypothetical protein
MWICGHSILGLPVVYGSAITTGVARLREGASLLAAMSEASKAADLAGERLSNRCLEFGDRHAEQFSAFPAQAARQIAGFVGHALPWPHGRPSPTTATATSESPSEAAPEAGPTHVDDATERRPEQHDDAPSPEPSRQRQDPGGIPHHGPGGIPHHGPGGIPHQHDGSGQQRGSDGRGEHLLPERPPFVASTLPRPTPRARAVGEPVGDPAIRPPAGGEPEGEGVAHVAG